MPGFDCLLLLQFLAYGMLIDVSHGIIGKNVRPATANEFPFAVSISRRESANKYAHLCTGTLMSARHVLTVAHCLLRKNTNDIEIIAGSRDWRMGIKFYPASWITYDEWKHGRREDKPFIINDIAIIRLEGDGVLHQNPPIPTARLYPNADVRPDYRVVRLAGWGVTNKGRRSPYLRTAVTTVLTLPECNEKATALTGKIVNLPPNYFCSQAHQWILTTDGDAGGPLIYLRRPHEVIGINAIVIPVVTESNHTEEYIHKHQLNTHLLLAPYTDFIRHFIV